MKIKTSELIDEPLYWALEVCEGSREEDISFFNWTPVLDNDTGFTWLRCDEDIDAMRCYVASKLGDEVEIPDELL